MKPFYVVIVKRLSSDSEEKKKTYEWQRVYSDSEESYVQTAFDKIVVSEQTPIKAMLVWSFERGIRVKYFCKLEDNVNFSDLWLGKDGVEFATNSIIECASTLGHIDPLPS